MEKKRRIIILLGVLSLLLVACVVIVASRGLLSLRDEVINSSILLNAFGNDSNEKMRPKDGIPNKRDGQSLDRAPTVGKAYTSKTEIVTIWEGKEESRRFNSFDRFLSTEIEQLTSDWDLISEGDKIDRLKVIRRDLYLLVEHLNIRQFEEIRDEIEVMLNCLRILSDTKASKVMLWIESEGKLINERSREGEPEMP